MLGGLELVSEQAGTACFDCFARQPKASSLENTSKEHAQAANILAKHKQLKHYEYVNALQACRGLNECVRTNE